jgi:hypothetical protein
MDAATAQKLIDALDVELERRRKKRHAALLAQWLEEPDYRVLYGACCSLQDQYEVNGSFPPDVLSEPVDADEAIWREEFLAAHGGREGLIEEIGETALVLMGRDQGLENAKNRIRPSYANRVRVRSMAKLLPDAKLRPAPAAPRPAERTGRRGEAPLVQPGTPEAEGRWLRGMVLTWNPRTWEGSVRAADGMEYRFAVGVLARSGMVTLVPGMKAEFKIVANECNQIKAAWH